MNVYCCMWIRKTVERHKGVVVLATLILLLATSFFPSSVSGTDRNINIPSSILFIDGDWIVSDTNVTENAEIILNGNLTITSTGNLTLSNVTLRINQTANKTCKINVEPGGSLYVQSGSNITSNNTYYYLFTVYGRLWMNGTQLSMMGVLAGSWGGIHVFSNDVYIHNSTIFNNKGAGITVEGKNLTVYNTIFYNCYRGILVETQSNLTVEGCTFRQLGDTGIDSSVGGIVKVNNSDFYDIVYWGVLAYWQVSASISNCTFVNVSEKPVYALAYSTVWVNDSSIQNINKWWGVYVRDRSIAHIRNLTASGCDNAIDVSLWSNLTLEHSNLSGNNWSGVYISQSNVTITDCTVNNNNGGLIVGSGYCNTTIINSTLEGNGVGVVCGAANTTLLNTTVSGSTSTDFDVSSYGWIFVEWFLHVYVIDLNDVPVRNANVRVYDLFGNLVSNGYTETDGCLRWIVATERTMNKSGIAIEPVTITYYTPHNITAEFNAVTNSTMTYIDVSKEVVIRLDIVVEYDPPVINHMPIAITQIGKPIGIYANVSDYSGVKDVVLYYQNVGDTWYTAVNMSLVSGDVNNGTWNATIPAQTITGNVHYFILASDVFGNNATAPMAGNYTVKICGPPVANAGPDQSVIEDEVVQFNGSGSTGDFSIIWYNWSFGDGSYGNGTNPTPSHAYPRAGIYVVTLNVTDSVGQWNSDTSTIFVNNVAPTANAGGNKSGNEGQPITFNGSASTDTPSDVPTHTYVWYFGDGNSASGKIVTHVYVDDGFYKATLMVTDDNGFTDSDTVNVTVSNVAPSITPVSDQIAQEGVPFTLKLNASDVPADVLTFSDNTTLFAIDPVTGIIQFTPTNDDVGMHHVRVNVTDDDGGSNSTAFNITVLNTNDAPVMAYIPTETATEDVLFALQVNASDPDVGDVLAYSLTASPDGMTIDDATGLISWTPTNADVGAHHVIVRVTDANGTFAERDFWITVANVNDPPIIVTTALPNATEGFIYFANVTAQDPDQNDVLTFSLTEAPAFLSIDPKSGLLYGIPTNADVGVHAVIVNVSDGQAFVLKEFNLTVSNVNTPPVITSTPPGIAKVSQTYNYTISAHDEDIGDTLTFGLSEAPEGMTIDSQTGTITWTPAEAQAGKTYQVVVNVSDGHATTVQTFPIVVENLPEESYHPIFDDYIWVGIVLFLIAMVILLTIAMRGREEE